MQQILFHRIPSHVRSVNIIIGLRQIPAQHLKIRMLHHLFIHTVAQHDQGECAPKNMGNGCFLERDRSVRLRSRSRSAL
jgi:hypothetical protein